MWKSLMSGMAVAAMATVATVSPAFGAGGADVKAIENPAVEKSTERITSEKLGVMLRNFGYEIRNTGTTKSPVYRFTEKRYGLTVPVYVSLSFDKSTLWIRSSVIRLPEKPDAGYLAKLMSSRLGKTHFVIQGRLLRIRRPVDNIAITPKSIRKQLNMFLADIKRTRNDWTIKKSADPSITKI